jgi:hypothetical protein
MPWLYVPDVPVVNGGENIVFRTRHQHSRGSRPWCMGVRAACALAATAILSSTATSANTSTITSTTFEANAHQARHAATVGTGQREALPTTGAIQFLTGAVSGSYNDSDWTLSKDSGNRNTIRHVNFTVPFANVPQVVINLSYVDTDNSYGTRVYVNASNITRYGFDAVFGTWADSITNGLQANWIAIG